MKKLASLLPLAAALLLALPASAVPVLIGHSGRLLDGNDHPVSGQKNVKFSLYKLPQAPFSGEDPVLWSETYAVVFSADGTYSVYLGTTREGKKALDGAVFQGTDPVFLAVGIVGEVSELSPRLPMGMVPVAHSALSAAALLPGSVVDAKSLKIGGVEVIGADGRWAGPQDNLNPVQLAGKPAGDYALKTDVQLAAATVQQTAQAADQALAVDIGLRLKTSDAQATYATQTQLTQTQNALGQQVAQVQAQVNQTLSSGVQKPLASACPAGQYLRGFDQAGAPACAMAVCPDGQGDCDGSAGNGCETAVNTSANCGGCGVSCSAGQSCSAGLRCVDPLVNATQLQKINGWASLPANTAWRLCFKASRDLSTSGQFWSLNGGSSIFHQQCDNQGATIMVAQMRNGPLMGGYTSVGYGAYVTGSCNYRNDAQAFLFSLTNNYRHAVITPSNAIYDCGSYGPTFGGGHDFYTNLTNAAYCNVGNAYACRVGSYGSTTCQNDLCGGYSPNIQDLEVYVRQ